MKPIMLAALMMISFQCLCQGVDGDRIILQDFVIDSLGYSQAELHAKTKDWFGHTFNNAKEVITSDSESGIVGRYTNSHYIGSALVDWYHTINTDFKDGKIRVRIWINYSGETRGTPANYYFNKKGEPRKMFNKGLLKLYDDSANMIMSLFRTIKGAKNDDW